MMLFAIHIRLCVLLKDIKTFEVQIEKILWSLGFFF